MSALLAAAGLEVSRSDSDPGHLNVDHPGTGFTVELDLREDRGSEWALRGDDEIEPGTTALRTASFVARLLSPEARSWPDPPARGRKPHRPRDHRAVKVWVRPLRDHGLAMLTHQR